MAFPTTGILDASPGRDPPRAEQITIDFSVTCLDCSEMTAGVGTIVVTRVRSKSPEAVS